jgi:rhodanese-related sulfurtransferase
VSSKDPEPFISVDDLLAEARRSLTRLTPRQAWEAMERGAALVDIRSESQRLEGGLVPGAAFIPRNVLEWRLDPASPHCIRELASRDRPVVLICEGGFQSSLAAATLVRMGVDATDVEGGFQAWRSEGLPTEEPG